MYRFILRCNSLESKPLWRTILDTMLLYFIPVCISGFFYFNIIKTLRNKERNKERNRSLSICFAISWILWVFCWTPKFAICLMEIPKKSFTYSLGKLGNKLLFYLYPSAFSLQVLYSQLNPFLYIILLKKFQANLIGAVKALTKSPATANSDGHSSWIRVAKTLLLALVMVLIFSQVVVTVYVASDQKQLASDFQASEVMKTLSESRSNFQLFSLRNRDMMGTDPLLNGRQKCSVNQAKFNFAFKRCYMVLENSNPGLNLSQQVDKCEQKGAVLSYPRSYNEVLFLWNFLQSERKDLTDEFRLQGTLHVGFRREKRK